MCLIECVIGNVVLARQANLFEDLAIYTERINYIEIEENTKLSREQRLFQRNCSTGHTLVT